MRLLKKEIWKILLRQKVLFWLLVFAVIKILSVNFSNDIRPEYDTKEYRQFLEQYGGHINYKKNESFNECYKEMLSATESINNLEDEYIQGKISEKEYIEQLQKATMLKNEQSLIEQFNDKMVYASKNPKQHFIIHDYGWEEILTKENIDILLIVFIFLIMVPMFCSEYESEMQYLHLCSKFGRNKLIAIKIGVGIVIALGMSVFSSVTEYFYYWMNGGMSYGFAPVQSLAFFENSNLNCSLFQIWSQIVICRSLGAVFLSVMIFLVSIFLKRSLLCIVTNIVAVIIPICFSNISNLKYMIPLPTGLLYATGFFYPDQYNYNIPEDIESFSEIEKYISFPAFTSFQRNLIFGIVVFILIGMIALIFKGYNENIRVINARHIYERIKKIRVSRSISCMFLVSCMVFTMSGCVRERTLDDEKFARTMHVGDSKTDRYEFTVDGNNITAEEISTGKQFPVIRDVFEQLKGDDDSKLSLVTIENYLFYSKVEDDEWQIHRVNLENFEDSCVYTKEVNNSLECSYYLALVSADNYFVCDAQTQKTFYIDRNTGKWNSLGYIGFLTLGDYGNKIYYEDQNNHLIEYDICDETKKAYDEIILPSQYSTRNNGAAYYIEDDYCYYRNMLKDNYIYKYSFTDGSNVLYSKDKSISDIEIYEDN